MQLISPTTKYKNNYIAYIKELGDEERYPFPLDFDYENFTDFLKKIEDYTTGTNIPNDAVPSSTFWLMNNDEIIGVTNLRHFLNKEIEFCGGHIGLGIRPSYRGKGIGKLLMAKSIEKLQLMGVDSVHIHCYKENTASAAMIVANGGELASELVDKSKVIQRYIVAAC